MKHIKKFNEATLYFNMDDYDTTDEYEKLFNVDNYNTNITMDLSYYVDYGLKKLFIFCEKYDIHPRKDIISELVNDMKSHTEDHILYHDQEDIVVDEEFGFIINYLKDLLKIRQPEEYKKIEMIDNAKKFNI